MKKKIILATVVMIFVIISIVAFLVYCYVKETQPINYAYYETGDDTFYVEWDDDNDTYDIFLVAEGRHIFIPRSETEIVIDEYYSDAENEICIIGEQYRSGKWKYKMYFIIYIDFSERN